MEHKTCNSKVNVPINEYVSRCIVASLNNDLSYDRFSTGCHLDSHGNMIVCGKDCYIISQSSHTAVVNAFTKDVGTIEVPIVDALLVYEDEMTGKIYYLIARNVLYVESMEYCLIPPFI